MRKMIEDEGNEGNREERMGEKKKKKEKLGIRKGAEYGERERGGR